MFIVFIHLITAILMHVSATCPMPHMNSRACSFKPPTEKEIRELEAKLDKKVNRVIEKHETKKLLNRKPEVTTSMYNCTWAVPLWHLACVHWLLTPLLRHIQCNRTETNRWQWGLNPERDQLAAQFELHQAERYPETRQLRDGEDCNRSFHIIAHSHKTEWQHPITGLHEQQEHQ